jgi:hypothetical protein
MPTIDDCLGRLQRAGWSVGHGPFGQVVDEQRTLLSLPRSRATMASVVAAVVAVVMVASSCGSSGTGDR